MSTPRDNASYVHTREAVGSYTTRPAHLDRKRFRVDRLLDRIFSSEKATDLGLVALAASCAALAYHLGRHA